MTNKDNLKKIKVGVYQMTPQIEEGTCKFVEKGYVKYGNDFDDEIINLTFLKNTDTKFKIDYELNRVYYNDDIYLQFYRDNVTSTYFTNTNKIPVFHCAVMFKKKVLLSNLFNIYLFFEINNSKSIKSFKQLTSSVLRGQYTLFVEFNDKQDILPMEKFVNLETLINEILELFTTETMDNLINEELEKQNTKRIQQYGQMDVYDIPQKVINFDDMVKKYKQNNGNMNEITELYKL